MKTILALVPLALLAAGCSSSGSGDVPIQQMPKTNADASAPGQGNPNVPQAAKDAMSGKTK